MTETTTPPATAPDDHLAALPAPCCREGAEMLAAWVAAHQNEDAAGHVQGEMTWPGHMVGVHRIVARRVPGCVDCMEWVAVLELGDDEDPDLDHPRGFMAAEHFVRHWVFDPLVAYHRAQEAAATLRKGEEAPRH
ncbi:hypothetical protein [Streptomyces sp. NPDC049879]|uniref:hypothetical protein n=1 Tax=Streptomyces sp. NPDC049879 TaxID=3365598 RepID=UPI0037889B3D